MIWNTYSLIASPNVIEIASQSTGDSTHKWFQQSVALASHTKIKIVKKNVLLNVTLFIPLVWNWLIRVFINSIFFVYQVFFSAHCNARLPSQRRICICDAALERQCFGAAFTLGAPMVS